MALGMAPSGSTTVPEVWIQSLMAWLQIWLYYSLAETSVNSLSSLCLDFLTSKIRMTSPGSLNCCEAGFHLLSIAWHRGRTRSITVTIPIA